jgi:hypothetical protein
LKRKNAALEFEMPLANYLPPRAMPAVENDPELAEDEDTLPGVSWPR